MNWLQTNRINNSSGISCIDSRATPWIVRGFNDVYAVDPFSGERIWHVDLTGDHSFGYKSVITAGNAVIVTAHQDKDPLIIWMSAFSLKTGRFLWERKLAWRLNDNFGGILQWKECVLFIENNSLSPSLYILDGGTGKQVLQGGAIAVTPCGISQEGPHTSCIIGNYAYFCTSQGLYFADIGKSDLSLEKCTGGNPAFLSAASGHLCYLDRERYEIVLFDGRIQQEMSRVLLPEPLVAENMILSDDTPDSTKAIVLLKKGQGLARVDFKNNHLVWHTGHSEKWYVSNAALTPFCIVVSVLQLHDGINRIFNLDYETGQILSEMQADMGLWEQYLHWTNDFLLIDNTQGASLFKWEGSSI